MVLEQGSSSIRVIVIGIIRRGDEILGFDVPDDTKPVTGFRPLGGGVEFGESTMTAFIREMAEELGTALEHVRPLGTLENIFSYMGQQRHEVVFVFEGEPLDKKLLQMDEIEFEEPEAPGIVKAIWRPLSTFREGRMLLYPERLLDLLDGKQSQPS